MNATQDEYDKDPRKACKYGINCYQRNALHISTYKHPPKTTNTNKRPVDGNIVIKQQNKKQKYGGEDKNNITHHNENSTENNANNKDTNNEVTGVPQNKLTNIDEKDFIKSKFLVNMPSDFYDFWNLCKKLNSASPSLALKDVGLVLVGPFDVLAGKFRNTEEIEVEQCVLHWRYFYDPPEFQTVIKSNDSSGYHLGYFRDSPDEMPGFLAYNFAKTDGTFKIVGDNLFAGVDSFLDFSKRKGNPFMQSKIKEYSNLIQAEAENLKLNMSRSTSKIAARDKKVLAKTFNKLGFVVPYNKRTQLGYRPLSISNKELQLLLGKLAKASAEEKDALMSELQVVLTNTSIAIDECDFGTGIELGLDILCSGVESLNMVVARLLGTCYRLLNREAFAVIVESHMKNRKTDFNLSVL